MADVDSNVASGVEVRGYRRGILATDSWDQYVIPTTDRIVSYTGRASAFITPGRAAVSQRLFAIHNATASAVLVDVSRISIDLLSTAVKLPTVITPTIRLFRFTAVPTNGTALTKTPLDTAQSSNAAVTLWGDASADGTGSATTLTVTVPVASALRQITSPRILSAVGYEPTDIVEFLEDTQPVVLRALEGLVVTLDAAVVTTGNPSTDRWLATCDWTEYTRP